MSFRTEHELNNIDSHIELSSLAFAQSIAHKRHFFLLPLHLLAKLFCDRQSQTQTKYIFLKLSLLSTQLSLSSYKFKLEDNLLKYFGQL